MSDNNDLLVRREDGVLVLTFNRPEQRNALTPGDAGEDGRGTRRR